MLEMLKIPSGMLITFAYCFIAIAAPKAEVEPKHFNPPTGYKEIIQPFVTKHCLSCHGEKSAKSGFRIDQLSSDFSVTKVADHWKEVIDRINAAEMPPKGMTKPEAKDATKFVDWVNLQLRDTELRAKNAGGRIPMRRLNRDEYANTVRDLLKIDENLLRPFVEELPGDGKAEGFDRLGVALFFDQTQIERSLDVAWKIAGRAIVTQEPKVNRLLEKFGVLRVKPPKPMIEAFPESKHFIPRGAEDRFIKPDFIEFLQGGPTYEKESDGWGVVHHFAISQVVKEDGDYRFRIKAKVDDRGRTEKNKFRLRYALRSPIQAITEVELDASGTTEVIMFLNGPSNGEVKGPQVFNLLWNHNEKSVIHEPDYLKVFYQRTGLASKLERAVTARAPQAELNALRKELDAVLHQLNTWEGPSYIYNPAMEIEKLPRLRITSIEIEGPIQKVWPPPSHAMLFFDGDKRQDLTYIREIFSRFLPRSYRRPVTKEEIDSIVNVVEKGLSEGMLSFADAMRVGLQRVLSAPGFLFLEEPSGAQLKPRQLNDFEFASRLSYFIWSTMPDDELFALAAKGKLNDPAIVKSQVQRMLSDPKAGQFVKNFGGQWLGVREYGSIQPAAGYKNYDKALELASQQEPYAFFSEVLNKNLPITSFLNSDFLVINERLAKHYEIDGVSGPEFRRVAITPEHHRGGVLGMAGLMTFLSDGTRTLPMKRGTWVLGELFNEPPNSPPPNAGEIQPNTSGKNLTVRQRLELHRNDAICASCHQKIDPYGLALENYDAIGQWREKANGEGFRANQAPVLDVSGTFPDGTKFNTLEQYKAGLLAKKEKFARSFSIKLLTYALGRPVGYPDTKLIDSFVETLKSNDYKIQTLIHAIALSEAFNTK